MPSTGDSSACPREGGGDGGRDGKKEKKTVVFGFRVKALGGFSVEIYRLLLA